MDPITIALLAVGGFVVVSGISRNAPSSKPSAVTVTTPRKPIVITPPPQQQQPIAPAPLAVVPGSWQTIKDTTGTTYAQAFPAIPSSWVQPVPPKVGLTGGTIATIFGAGEVAAAEATAAGADLTQQPSGEDLKAFFADVNTTVLTQNAIACLGEPTAGLTQAALASAASTYAARKQAFYAALVAWQCAYSQARASEAWAGFGAIWNDIVETIASFFPVAGKLFSTAYANLSAGLQQYDGKSSAQIGDLKPVNPSSDATVPNEVRWQYIASGQALTDYFQFCALSCACNGGFQQPGSAPSMKTHNSYAGTTIPSSQVAPIQFGTGGVDTMWDGTLYGAFEVRANPFAVAVAYSPWGAPLWL